MSDFSFFGFEVGNNILSQGLAFYRDKLSRDWQEKMWNAQNEYNLPINQRKRLEEAGINPNLAFGSSASAMGGSVPGSPSTHVPSVNLGDFWLKYKDVKSQIKARDAQTARDNEVTEQLKMNNEVLSQLLSDKIQTERGDLFVRRIEQAWKEDNLKHLLDLGLSEKETRILLHKAEKLLADARTAKTDEERKRVIQEFEHMTSKYGFEDDYYSKGWNPYETNTAIGFLRMILGPMMNFAEILNEYLGLGSSHNLPSK